MKIPKYWSAMHVTNIHHVGSWWQLFATTTDDKNVAEKNYNLWTAWGGGHMKRGGGPHLALGPPVGHSCITSSSLYLYFPSICYLMALNQFYWNISQLVFTTTQGIPWTTQRGIPLDTHIAYVDEHKQNTDIILFNTCTFLLGVIRVCILIACCIIKLVI